MLSAEILEKIRSVLVAKFNPEKILLFGSQARGSADRYSDIDIVVITEAAEDKFSLMNQMRRVLSNLDHPVDVIVMSNTEYTRDKKYPGTIARYASQEGILLYGK